MPHTVIVTPQIPLAFQCGGIGAFVYNFVRVLRNNDHNVTILYTEPPQKPETDWVPHYEELGVRIKSVQKYSPNGGYSIEIPQGYPPGYHLYVRLSEVVADRIPTDAEIVYLADWRANGLHLVRSKRYSQESLPLTISVIHGPSGWHREGMQLWPVTYDDLAIDYLERYVAEHSDFAVAPSQYTANWAADKRWALPEGERSRVMLYPFIPNPDWSTRQVSHADRFARVVFYGRLETRKGLDLFVDAMSKLRGKRCLSGLEEIVLLGGPGVNIYGDIWKGPNLAAQIIETNLGIRSRTIMNLDTFDAQRTLASWVEDSLVVVPSRAETVGFTIIEASLIAGLNIVTSDVGGIPEVLGSNGQHQLFEPYVQPLTRKLEEWLQDGPRPASELGRYDWEAANSTWLKFHEEMCERVEALKRPSVRSAISLPSRPDGASVDICIPHYNLGTYLPDLLESLEKQTTSDFNVFIVDDGSTEPASVAVFEEMKSKYQSKGWQFISSANNGPSVARNLAAALGTAEYILFMDADNLAAPNMVERFVQAIRTSNDDVLSCYMYSFTGDTPFFAHTAKSLAVPILKPAILMWAPIGNAPAASILYNTFGDINAIMRRSAFEEVGGFTEDYSKYVNQEDRELMTRLSLAGYKLDVIPEFLFYYRHREDSRFRQTEIFANDRRIMRTYQSYLAKVGLEDLAPLLLGTHYWLHETLRGKQPRAQGLSEVDYLVQRTEWYTILKGATRKFRRDKYRAAREIASALMREVSDRKARVLAKSSGVRASALER